MQAFVLGQQSAFAFVGALGVAGDLVVLIILSCGLFLLGVEGLEFLNVVEVGLNLFGRHLWVIDADFAAALVQGCLEESELHAVGAQVQLLDLEADAPVEADRLVVVRADVERQRVLRVGFKEVGNQLAANALALAVDADADPEKVDRINSFVLAETSVLQIAH